MAAIDNPAEWIVLLFNKHARESDHWDCEIFPEGAVIPKLPMADSELVYGVYKDKYYFSPAAIYVMDDKGCRRIHWRSIIKCSSFHGCGKANSRLKLIDGTNRERSTVRSGDRLEWPHWPALSSDDRTAWLD